jgi:hypothetical protein
MINGNKGKESEGLKMVQGGLGDAEELSTPIFSYLHERPLRNPLIVVEDYLSQNLSESNAGFVGYCIGWLIGLY